MATFGYETAGASATCPYNEITGSKFTCPSSGKVSSISAHLYDIASPASKFKCAIYKHSDSTLIANGVSEEKTGPYDPAQWVTFNFTGTKPLLEANTEYVLVILADTQECTISYDDGDTNQGHYQIRNYADGFPSTASFTHNDRKCSIYATYTPFPTKTISGTARIEVTLSKTITGNAKACKKYSKTIGANARIEVPITKTVTGNADIWAPTIHGKARILVSTPKTITGNARVESIQYYDTQLSYRFDRENKARAIAAVANSIGYEWGVTPNDILSFHEQRGHDKSATITLSDDIIEVDNRGDATKIIDKLTVVGMGPGGSHLEVTVGTGDMEGTFTAKDIHDIDTLTSYANAMLEQTQEAKHRMLIKLVGSDRTDIELGDIVHVTHTDSGIDDDYRIISMERVSGVAGEYIKLEIAVPQFRVTDTLKDVERRADAEDYHPQGAPSILTLARADNVDATHSLKMKFYVPPESVDMGKLQIKEARIALTLETFRAYSTSATGGGGQTTGAGSAHSHTITGQTTESAGDHRHLMFNWYARQSWVDPTYRSRFYAKDSGGTSDLEALIGTDLTDDADLYTYAAGGSHSHNITGITSETESLHVHLIDNHTHNIVYGIYESTSPADVYIKLNGVQIAGPYNADGYIDITTEFLNQITTYGWNTLEFTSTQLGKIGATLFMRLFLQAS